MALIKLNNQSYSSGSAFLPTGNVLQVVTSANNSSMHTTTSSTFSSTSSTASITPSSTSSKVYVIASCDVDINDSNTVHYLTIYRGSTNIGLSTTADGGISGLSRVHDVSAGRYLFRQMLQVLDTPSSTPSTTYTLYQRASQGTARVRNDLILAQITLIEIQG